MNKEELIKQLAEAKADAVHWRMEYGLASKNATAWILIPGMTVFLSPDADMEICAEIFAMALKNQMKAKAEREAKGTP